MPKGSFQQENGVNISGRDGGQVFDGTNTRLRFGIAQCLEFLVDVPTYFDALSGNADTGFTNVMPAVKWQISPVPGKIDLSATFGVGVPTGTRAIAGQGAQPYVQFPWSYELADGWGLSGMFTSFFSPSNPDTKIDDRNHLRDRARVRQEDLRVRRICRRLPRARRAELHDQFRRRAIASPIPSRSISTSPSGSTTSRRPTFSASATRSASTICSDAAASFADARDFIFRGARAIPRGVPAMYCPCR